MVREPSIFDEVDAAAEEAADAEGLADIAAGRVVPHAEVSAWLETWGTPDEKPMPASWLKSSGRAGRFPTKTVVIPDKCAARRSGTDA